MIFNYFQRFVSFFPLFHSFHFFFLKLCPRIIVLVYDLLFIDDNTIDDPIDDTINDPIDDTIDDTIDDNTINRYLTNNKNNLRKRW